MNNCVIDKEICVEPAAKRQYILVNFFPGYAILAEAIMLNCDPLSIVNVTSINNIVPGETEFLTENISEESEDQSCDELISWVNGERPSSSLRSPILEKFDRLDELEEIRIEPAAKRQRIL